MSLKTTLQTAFVALSAEADSPKDRRLLRRIKARIRGLVLLLELPDPIDTNRAATLRQLAVDLRNAGFDRHNILVELIAANKSLVRPRLPMAALMTIAGDESRSPIAEIVRDTAV